MSGVFFISDLHFKHKNVNKFEDFYRPKAMGLRGCKLETLIEIHDKTLIRNINSCCTKRDKLYILGDHGYTPELINEIDAQVVMLLGNHDRQPISEYVDGVNAAIEGPHAYKGFWITHFPIHPCELWGKKNIHGHVHSKSVPDENYINVSVEACGGVPVNFEDIKSGKYFTHK